MKKMLMGFLIVLMGKVAFVQSKTEYKHLSQLPAESVIKRKCENVDESGLVKRTLYKSPCDSIDEALSKLDDILVDIAEKRKPLNQIKIYLNGEKDAVQAKIQKDFEDLKQTAAIPAGRILAGKSPSVINNEWKLAQEYAQKRYAEIEQETGWF
jgi:hypothetical protein